MRELPERRRLSCSATIQGDLVVDVPQDVQINPQIVRKRAETRVIERDPIIQLCYVEVDEPDMHKPLGDIDRLLARAGEGWGFKRRDIDFHLLPKVQNILREGEWKVTAAVHQDEEGRDAAHDRALAGPAQRLRARRRHRLDDDRLPPLLAALRPRAASAGTPNPQIRFGEDLMSRVSYVMMNPDGREAMTKAVREAIGC